jgi:transketolase
MTSNPYAGSYASRDALIAVLKEKALFSRTETIRLIERPRSGHYGSAFSCAEIFAVLYYYVLRYDPGRPELPERDRFVLSKGHAAVGLYPIMADVGFFSKELLDTYTRFRSPLGDHPDMRCIAGCDFSSGSLGHGLSEAVGMALAARLDRAPTRVFCLMGDGECQEGQIWEAAMSAAHFELGRLVGIVDRNQVSVGGTTEESMAIEPLSAKWRAFGWEVRDVDGHDLTALVDCFDRLPPVDSDVPTVIIAHTVAGKGVRRMEGSFAWHLGYLAPEDAERALRELRPEGET